MKTSLKQSKKDELFVGCVISFYEKYGRHNLVWRKKITAYRILVSEIMLQQTQVQRVLPKFEMWMKLYPTLEKLQHATLQDILILWQGLGYQRRAKALYNIGQMYTKIPKKFDDICMLPGVGIYTASAVCAFAYNDFSHPLLETNIRTALIEEFHQGESDIPDGILYDDLSRLVTNNTIQKIGARKWYYALMDYGSYLKENKISHNQKSVHHVKQSMYKGSLRELRAKVLFAITHKKEIPEDERLTTVLEDLLKEGFIIRDAKKGYTIKN